MVTATDKLLARRAKLLGPNVPTFYEDPLHLVRGEGVWVWDADGNKYLDCYNNVPHVGHCHPHVVAAIANQAATLNTHTRYLHEGILDYVERLTDTFSASLDTAILTCTGSEANDIALRMAEAVTGKRGVVATDHTYHGNTSVVAQLSRTNPSTFGHSNPVRHIPAPDSVRPLGGVAGAAHAKAFTQAVANAIDELENSEHGFSALILCPAFINEGFPSLPPGWLDEVRVLVKRAGGVFIADEVQPGFGRLGTHFWGHQRIGITPDIVTLGKPMGNGHPIGGVVAGSEIMTAFRSAFRYFNTYGGNPVSCAAASAMLDVLHDESLVENANDIGEYARSLLTQLASRHPAIGDVRGYGLVFGAEIVVDQTSLTPAPAYVNQVVNALRHRGILINRLGINYNTLKIRPPMPFSKENADFLVDELDQVLTELGAPRN